MALSRQKIALVFGEKYSILVIQLATSLIAARLLTPEDFGVYSLAAGVAALLSVFRDFGVGQYLVQEKTLTRRKMRAALGIMMATSLLMAILFIGVSAPIASYYDEPRLTRLLILLGVNFLFMPAGALAYCSWRRDLHFGKIAFVNVAAACTSAVVTLVLAWYGGGSTSLALGLIAGSVTTAALCLATAPTGLPQMPSFIGAKPILRYATVSTMEALIRTVSERLSTLLLGKSVTMSTLGIFERAQSLGGLFNQAIMQSVYAIAFPAVSHAVRSGQEVGKPYVHAVAVITALGFAFYTWATVFADQIVRGLLGEQWMAAAGLLGLVCLRNALALPSAMAGGLIVGHGRIAAMTWLTTVTHSLNIASIVVALPFGIHAILWSNSLAAAVGTAITVFVTKEYHNGKDMVTEILRSAGSIVPPALIALYIQSQVGNSFVALVAGTAGAAFCWLLTLCLLRHPLWFEVCKAQASWFHGRARQ